MESQIAMKVLIYLGAAIIMVPLVRKLGLSSVVGYILGGIIIGPFVLKLSGDNAEDIMHASEFGVVMLLFLIGLELEPKKFWAMRKQILGLGLLQMLLTILLLTGILVPFGWDTKQALVIAMCFSLSSTAIVLQTLQEKSLFGTQAGQASFSTLLFQDIAVIPILVIIPVLTDYDTSQVEGGNVNPLIQTLPEWMQSMSVIFGVGILLLLSRYVFVPFLRYVSKSGMIELLLASSLFLVIGVSELMKIVGLSPALGAFIAGVMLANSEFRHELESQIEPLKGLLLAVFFVSVGSAINFNVIAEDPLFISTMVVLVLVVKFVVLFGIGKLFKFHNSQNFFYAFALSQVGEFAFVLLNYSSSLFLFDEHLTSQLMAITAITMGVTPLLLIINEKVILKKINSRLENSDQPFDVLKAEVPQKNIIIVGFGNFGSVIGRLLRANKLKATVLDNDPERVRLLRKFGFNVFYGDPTRLQTLRTAGIKQAEILVLCLGNPESNKNIAELVREKYPETKIFVRAKDRDDSYYYLNHGIKNIYRETLGTSVEMAVDILHELGMRKYAAQRLGNRFMMIDKLSVKKMAKQMDSGQLSTFAIKEAIQHEQALLDYDNLTFENHDWLENDELLDDEDLTNFESSIADS